VSGQIDHHWPWSHSSCTVAGNDYALQSELAVFTPGGPDEVVVMLSVRKDAILEANETYTLLLALTSLSQVADVQIGRRHQAKVTIINDDSKTACYKIVYLKMLFY